MDVLFLYGSGATIWQWCNNHLRTGQSFFSNEMTLSYLFRARVFILVVCVIVLPLGRTGVMGLCSGVMMQLSLPSHQGRSGNAIQLFNIRREEGLQQSFRGDRQV